MLQAGAVRMVDWNALEEFSPEDFPAVSLLWDHQAKQEAAMLVLPDRMVFMGYLPRSTGQFDHLKKLLAEHGQPSDIYVMFRDETSMVICHQFDAWVKA